MSEFTKVEMSMFRLGLGALGREWSNEMAKSRLEWIIGRIDVAMEGGEVKFSLMELDMICRGLGALGREWSNEMAKSRLEWMVERVRKVMES